MSAPDNVTKQIIRADDGTIYFEIYLENRYIGFIRRVSDNTWSATETLPVNARGAAILSTVAIPGTHSQQNAIRELVAASSKREAAKNG